MKGENVATQLFFSFSIRSESQAMEWNPYIWPEPSHFSQPNLETTGKARVLFFLVICRLAATLPLRILSVVFSEQLLLRV